MDQLDTDIESVPSSLIERVIDDDLKVGIFDIANKSTIFFQIDKALKRSKSCSVEYLFTKPHALVSICGFGFNVNWYGHSAVIYTMPDGTRKVFNITGINGKNPDMVTFYTPEDYLFDRNPDQGGIFNRNFIGIRVENIPNENIIAMDTAFQEIKANSITGKAKFDIMFGPVYNTFRQIFPSLAEYGNCARWSSLGLQKAGLVTHRSMFPKSIFIDMLENAEQTTAKSHKNVNVVSYNIIPYAKRSYGTYSQYIFDMVGPFQPLRNLWYWNLDAYARISINVKYPDNVAEVTVKHPDLVKKPNKYRNMIVNNEYSILLFGIATLVFIRRYPIKMIQNHMYIFCQQKYTNLQTASKIRLDRIKKRYNIS